MPLIARPDVVTELRLEWAGAVAMRERMRTLIIVTFATGRITATPLRSVLYNLPMLLAFDVLRQVLCAARDEGCFSCRSDHLGKLMEDAKGAISWVDWDRLRAGVRRRNEIAHDGTLFTSDQCIGDIESIREQCVAWGIIDAQ